MLALGYVESFPQTTRYTCSAATLGAVLKHWGYGYSEQALAQIIGVDPKEGATNQQIVAAAQRLSFDAKVRLFTDIDELKAFTDRDIPVILNILSFLQPGRGHFVVATQIDARHVRLMDPSAPENWRVIPRSELDRRWRTRQRAGVIVIPGARSHRPVAQAG